MILLDTNVQSESMRPQPNPFLIAWVNAITQTEISLGIALLPDGKRRDADDFKDIPDLALVDPC